MPVTTIRIKPITPSASSAWWPDSSTNSICSAAFGLAIAMGGWSCAAQETSNLLVPFPEAPQPRLTLAADESRTGFAADFMPGFASAAGLRPAHPTARPHIVDRQFLMLNGLHLGMAILDEQITQHCIADHQCREGNPMMPSSQAGQITIDLALVAYGTGLSYWLKKHKSRWWRLPPDSGIATHTVGVSIGLLH
jgi:hypothetical protein